MDTDPIYQQGLKHFGLGQWSEAVACFTQLQATYPDDPRITQFLETARLRAAAGAGLQAGARRQTRSIWLQRLSRVLVLLVFVAIIGGVIFAYQTWVVPTQAENARLTRLDQLRRTGETQIASGAYSDAASTYQAVLAEVPGDPIASAGLSRAQQLGHLADLYAQATQALNAGKPGDALRLLTEISGIDPAYRDTNTLLSQLRSTQDLTAMYDQAVQQYQANDLQTAAQSFEAIRTADRNFKSQEITDYLFNAYMQLADRQLKQAGTVNGLQLADSLYQKALSVRPLEPRADAARRLTAAVIDGNAAYQLKDWDTVILKMSPVYQQQPDYFGGQVQQWLYEAYISTGDQFMAKGDPFTARDRFAMAVQLASTPQQKADAQKRYDAANKLTTPTPTPRPTPTEIPAGHVAPAWTLRPTGTPNPNPFIMINMTYLPNFVTGDGCSWAGIAGRFFDRQGNPLVVETLGMRITGPGDAPGVAAGSYLPIGESGWIEQFDARSKEIEGFVQVYYHDEPVSDPIPYKTSAACLENMLIIDVQQVKPLPGGIYLYTPKTSTKK